MDASGGVTTRVGRSTRQSGCPPHLGRKQLPWRRGQTCWTCTTPPRQDGEVTRRAPSPGRSRVRLGVLAALALIAAAGIIPVVLGQPSTRPHASSPPSSAVAAALAALLRQGTPDTAPGYWQTPSATLQAAAAGADDARFRALGALLVQDGFAGAIINLGPEMNASWYNWSEQMCPRPEPDCFALAWRHAVDAMRSVPGQHFRFLWTVYPNSAAAVDAWPGPA